MTKPKSQQWSATLGRAAIGGLVIMAALMGGCGSQTASKSNLPRSAAGDRVTPSPISTSPQPLQPPMIAGSQLQPVPVPNLIPPTTVPERLPDVSTGRTDPFSTLLVAPTLIERQATPPSTALSPPMPVPAAPTVAVAPLPAFQPPGSLPTFQPGTAPSPPVNPISTAQAIEVSGVVQTGSKTSIIVKVPDERTSRYATVGERLANGRVLIKRVEMGAEPVVILEQDGQEIVKSIGNSGGSMMGSL
jgi:hypothetical protein